MEDTNYINIQGWMVNHLSLKANQLLAFALIFGFSQDRESSFKGSLKYVQKVLQVSRPTASEVLKSLVEMNLIIKNSKVISGVIFNSYKANFEFLDSVLSGKNSLGVVKNIYRGSKESLQGGSKDSLQGGSKDSLHNNTIIDNTTIDNTNDNFNADASEKKSGDIFDFEKVWYSFRGKRDSFEKDFRNFLKKSEGVDVDFENLYKLSQKVNNVYFQTWLNDVLPKAKEFGKSEFRQSLLDAGVDPQHAEDWMKVRTVKRAPFTKTVIDSLFNECDKNNFKIKDAVKLCAEKSWIGFEYKWVLNLINNGKSFNNTASQGRQQRVDEVEQFRVDNQKSLASRLQKHITGNTEQPAVNSEN